jgi:hypothetical protein
MRVSFSTSCHDEAILGLDGIRHFAFIALFSRIEVSGIGSQFRAFQILRLLPGDAHFETKRTYEGDLSGGE